MSSTSRAREAVSCFSCIDPSVLKAAPGRDMTSTSAGLLGGRGGGVSWIGGLAGASAKADVSPVIVLDLGLGGSGTKLPPPRRLVSASVLKVLLGSKVGTEPEWGLIPFGGTAGGDEVKLVITCGGGGEPVG